MADVEVALRPESLLSYDDVFPLGYEKQLSVVSALQNEVVDRNELGLQLWSQRLVLCRGVVARLRLWTAI